MTPQQKSVHLRLSTTLPSRTHSVCVYDEQRKPAKRLTEKERVLMRKLYKEGFTQEAIAERLDVSASTISVNLR